MQRSDLFKKSATGGRWATLGIIIQKSIGFLSFLVLSRILSPEHYGSMATAMMVIAFLDIFSMSALESALLHRREEDKDMLNIVWTLNVLRGIFFSILIYFSAPFIVEFFKFPAYLNLVRATAFLVFIRACLNIGLIFLSYELNFYKIFIKDISEQVVYIVVTLIAILIFKPSVWILFAGQVALSGTAFVSSFILSGYRPRLNFNFKKIKSLLSYSKWMWGQNILSYFSNMLDSIFLARLLAKDSLGLYVKSRDLSTIPSSYLYQVIYKVGFPVYSKIQNSAELVKKSFIKTFEIAAILSLPFFLVILAYGFEIINFLFGLKWIGMTFPLQLLSIAMIFKSFTFIMYPLFDGTGRPGLRFKLMLCQFFVFIASLFILTPKYGMVGAAVSVNIASFTSFILGFFYIIRNFKISLRDIFSSFIASFLPALFCYFFVKLQKLFLPLGLYESIIAAALLPIIYFALLIIISKLIGNNSYKTILKFIR